VIASAQPAATRPFVTGPTTTISTKGKRFIFTPKKMTVPDVGTSACSPTNYSFAVNNDTSSGVWLTRKGQVVWFIPAHKTGVSNCFSASFSRPLHFELQDNVGHHLEGKLTLIVS
jgi:hypothetical protein